VVVPGVAVLPGARPGAQGAAEAGAAEAAGEWQSAAWRGAALPIGQ
jgi:hypothetical protein